MVANARIDGTQRGAQVSVGLPRVGGDVGVSRQTRHEKVYGVELRMRIYGTRAQAERRSIVGHETRAERGRIDFRVIILVADPRGIEAVRCQAFDAEAERPDGTAEDAADRSVKGIVGARLYVGMAGAGSGMRTRDDMDDAAHRIATPERALRTAHDFDAFDICRGQVFPAKFITGRGIVGAYAVDEHQYLVRLGAAHPHLSLAHLAPLDVVTRDDGNGIADVCRRNGRARACYDDSIHGIVGGESLRHDDAGADGGQGSDRVSHCLSPASSPTRSTVGCSTGRSPDS